MSTVGSTGRGTNTLEGGDVSALVANVVNDVAVLLADSAAIVDCRVDIRTVNLLTVLKSGSALNLGG